MVKWSLRDSTGCKQRGEIELAQIPGELLRFEREAARIMKRTGADHVLYGIKIYDQDDCFCDWDGDKSLCYRMVEEFWKSLEDVPFNEDADGRLILANDYRFMVGSREIAMFPKGTDREEIWHWFDENHPKGVAYLLYRGENKTEVYFSIEDGNDLQLDIAHTREDAISKCKENPEAREVFAFRMIGENHELLSCVFSKDNEGGKEE